MMEVEADVSQLFPLLLAVCATGCLVERSDDGGQFGEESGSECKAVAHTPLADDEVSPLGFSPDELRALVPESSLPFDWADGGATTLTLTPEAVGPVEYVEYRVVQTGSGGAEPALTRWCPNQVELGYQLGFHTTDGAFDEVWSLRIVGDTAARARAFVSTENFSGTFDAAAFAPLGNDYEAISVGVDLAWSGLGPSGMVWGQGSGTDGDVAFAEQFAVGSWGSEGR
jgi:hypothetical protein